MNIKLNLASLVLAGTLALGACPFASAARVSDFTDVKPGDWYYSAVDHVAKRNYFNGVSATAFAPNSSMNRAMAVTVLARMFAGDLDGYSGKTPFTDVPSDAYYAKAVQWAVQKGITNGTSAITFSPDSTVTREQISTFLYNAVKATGKLGDFDASVFNTFGDKGDVASWAADALKWATSKGIIAGSDGKLLPKDPTTRAAFATITMNYDNTYNSSPEPDPVSTPISDLEPTLSEDNFAESRENQVNDLLTAAWGVSDAPQRDTEKLAQAARVIASGEIKDVEEALTSVGFDRPVGTVYHNKYIYDRYDVKKFLVTTGSVQQAVTEIKKQDSLMYTGSFTEYGVGVYRMNDIQFRVAVVTYRGVPYSSADTEQMRKDWLAEQDAAPVTLSDIEQQVVDLTNQERAKYGLPLLKTSADMQKAATIRAKEATVRYSHSRPDGRDCISVYSDIGCILYYTNPATNADAIVGSAGENLAGGVFTPEEVVSGWMGSSGHRRAILNKDFTYIGVSLAPRIKDGVQQGYYWVQCFLGI